MPAMRSLIAIFLVAVVSLVAGCIGSSMKEGYLVITGKIFGEFSEACYLSLQTQDPAVEFENRRVVQEFREEFTISPRHEVFEAHVSCDEKTVAARTVRYGRDVEFGGEVPLGEIVL